MGLNNTQVACLDINLFNEKKGEKKRGREAKNEILLSNFHILFHTLK